MKEGKIIKFSNKYKPTFYNELKKVVDAYFKDNALSTSGGVQILIKAIFMLSLYLVPYFLILSGEFTDRYLLLLACVMGIGIAGVGMCVMHDANHGSFSGNSRINQIFGWTMFVLGGNVYNWKKQHNSLHHIYTSIHAADEDITGKFLLRLSYEEKIKKVHQYQHLYAFLLYGLMTFSFMVKDFKQIFHLLDKETDETYPKEEGVKLIVGKVLYFFMIALLPLMLTNITFSKWLLGFFAMHFAAGLILSIIFQLAHVVDGVEDPQQDVEGNIKNNWAIHQMNTTANFSGNSILSWFIGGLDYQIEHHLFPGISHVHYNKISKLVRKVAKKHNVPYHLKASFTDALLSHIKRLKALGHEEAKEPSLLSGELMLH